MSRKIFEVKDFRGVDYTTPQLAVSNHRATEICNVIFKNGYDQVREPYEQVASSPIDDYYLDPDNIFPNEDYTNLAQNKKLNPNRVNAIWSFYGEDNELHTIAHIGHLLYEINGIGADYDFKKATFTCLSHSHLLLNETVKAVSSNRLYVFGGVKYLFVYIEGYVTKVDDVFDHKLTYKPVTTIGIVYPDSPVQGSRQSLDLVSRNTQWRRNKCISGTRIDDGVTVRKEMFYTYTLDRSIVAKDVKDLNDIKVTINRLVRSEN